MKGLFIFRRDFRVNDNLALQLLSRECNEIIPIFITTPEQTKNNEYFSNNSFQFLTESLEDLNLQTGRKLKILYGDNIDIIKYILENNENITHVGFNEDYTPYAKKRDDEIFKLCEDLDIDVITAEDYTIYKRDDIRSGKTPYFSVFKAFYTKVLKLKNPELLESKIKFVNNFKIDKKFVKSLAFLKKLYVPNKNVLVHGGRKNALNVLKKLNQFKDYDQTRNNPNINTTLLSAYIKYGCVSIREVYLDMIKKVGKNNELTRQLIWHDFYAILMYYLPEKRTIGGGNFKNKSIRWRNSPEEFKRWCEGTTGVPIIDAAMRQLNTVGWMHNRCRLLVSNYLTMVLKIDWHLGEKYFANKLIDYDVTSNNLNWQFSTGIGTDRTPYVRIYNPYKQSKDIDKDCEYIKKWIPELRSIECDMIHKWDTSHNKVKVDYPKPMK
jgi:deoxyribodipyrimidine photo-lyase